MNYNFKNNTAEEFLNLRIIPEYKKNQNLLLKFGFLFTFSVILIVIFFNLSYFFYTFIIVSLILGVIIFYLYQEFQFAKKQFDTFYPYFNSVVEEILDNNAKNISKSMVFWIFIIRAYLDHNVYSPLLLNSIKDDINHIDYYGNTILHYILYNNNDNQNKIYISHAILSGANLDIKNDKSITPRFLLSQKYPEYLAIIEQIEILKSFKK